MNGKLYLFNPENDLALAAGTANYTPAANVREFHRAGAMLPLWYSNGKSTILGDCTHSGWLVRKCDEFGFEAAVTDVAAGCYELCPWGWSANTIRQFENAGVAGSCLPDMAFAERMRQLSHRRSAAWMSRRLAALVDYQLPEPPVEAVSLEQVHEFVTRHDGCFVKSPWSGSGRGVVDSTLIPVRQLDRIADGIIRRQGSVMLEPRLDKMMDFAMLFESSAEAGCVRHVGYSAFFNETANAYGGNRIMTDDRLCELLASEVGYEPIGQTVQAIVPLLAELLHASGYNGYLGVDMMVYRSSSREMLICPAVEINLRMTMGVVAWHLGRNVVAPGHEATLRVRYAPDGPVADNYIVRSGRIVSGELNLVPVSGPFRFTLSVD